MIRSYTILASTTWLYKPATPLSQWIINWRETLEGSYVKARLMSRGLPPSLCAGVQHEGWSCNWCPVSPITGTLWRCVHCPRYSLCSQCYHSGKHCLEHQFQRLDTPDSHRSAGLEPVCGWFSEKVHIYKSVTVHSSLLVNRCLLDVCMLVDLHFPCISPNSVRVGSRMVARRVESQGIFTGAAVMRGADWRWEDQDGKRSTYTLSLSTVVLSI